MDDGGEGRVRTTLLVTPNPSRISTPIYGRYLNISSGRYKLMGRIPGRLLSFWVGGFVGVGGWGRGDHKSTVCAPRGGEEEPPPPRATLLNEENKNGQLTPFQIKVWQGRTRRLNINFFVFLFFLGGRSVSLS